MSDAMMELRKLVALEAIWDDATWRAAASAALAQMDEFRTLLGANEGESTVDALHRYTAAVQLGCALKLEQQSAALSNEEMPTSVVWNAAIKTLRDGIPVAALIGGATLLRQGVEAETQQPTRYPCSPNCTHDDAATPGHPERVKERSEAFNGSTPDGKALLREWLSRNGMTQRTFATSLGLHEAAVSYYLSGRNAPLRGIAAEIERATDGAVPASTWPEDARGRNAAPRDACEDGAEAMRAACWALIQTELRLHGWGPGDGPWTRLKSAIEGAAP